MSAVEGFKRVAYYKGCLASLSAKELDTSTQALAPRVGLELVELESVTCCGAGDIHEAEPDYYLHLNARILAYAEATGCDTLMTVCNVCTLNLRQANWILTGDDSLRERVNRNLESVGVPPYSGTVEVRHLLWEIAEGDGYEKLREAAHKGLKGLKVAPFYGCQILRPSKILGFEDPDRPWSLERIIEACGGEAIDYPAKIKCCGFPIIQAREETAMGELIQPVEQALDAGADVMVTPCPLCHLSLDAWQQKLEAATGRPRGVRAEVQAPHRRSAARARTARGLSRPRGASLLAGSAAAGLAWGSLEAGWLRRRQLELALPALPPTLDGLRIAHLSDFHLGVPSRGARAVERGVGWVAERRPDLVAITGDLLTHPRGEPLLRALVERLPQPAFAVLGNHDLAISRDPQARRSNLRELAPARLLRDEAAQIEVRGHTIRVAGTHPRLILRRGRKLDPNALAGDADLRILLCHFPRVLDQLEPGSFDLVLAGHMHDGQITVPYPGGKLRLAHPSARYAQGVYRSRAAVMHVSPGLGTTFLPLRFAARPEATELVLRSS